MAVLVCSCSTPRVSSPVQGVRSGAGRSPVVPRSSATGSLHSTDDAPSTSGRPLADLLAAKLALGRQVLPPPQPVPIHHSSVYLDSMSSVSSMDADDGQAARAVAVRGEDVVLHEFDGNALQWLLLRADRSLDELEENPLPLQRAVYDITRSPAAQTTSRGVSKAAELTWSATQEAVRIVAPAGRWAVKQGVKAAGGLIATALLEGTKAALSSGSNNKKQGRK